MTTFDGSRREQLRYTQRMTLRERLQALDELTRLSERLQAMPRAVGSSGGLHGTATTPMNVRRVEWDPHRHACDISTLPATAGSHYHALIGGLALAPYNVIRATQDIDLLVDLEKADEIEIELTRLSYRCLYRSEDAGNYVRGDERVDLLYAHRPIAKRLLGGAVRLATTLGEVHVISKEGLAAFKLQGLVNDPRRTQDLEDLRMLVKRRGQLDLTELREYFRLFDRESFLDELLREID